jgi:hypothetical protein
MQQLLERKNGSKPCQSRIEIPVVKCTNFFLKTKAEMRTLVSKEQTERERERARGDDAVRE